MRKRKFFSSAFLIAAFTFAVSNVFVSCKDYDDDIDANTELINDLNSQLTDVKSALTQELNDVKAQLDANNSAGAVARLTAQINAVDDALDKVQSSAEESATTLAAVTGDLEKYGYNLKTLGYDLDQEAQARKALEENLRIQTNALDELKKQVGDDKEDLQGQIDELNSKISNFATDGTVEELQNKVKELSEAIQTVNGDVDALTVLIERALTSIALVPELYIDGIEAIEFLSVNYTPLMSEYHGEYGNDYNKIVSTFKKGNDITIDNGLTEATYRLNPSTVNKDCYDESGIEFVSTIAETRSVTPVEGSPVMFNGVKSFEKGLMTIYVKKNPAFTTSLNLGSGKAYIASLKVPRNAKKYEAADIFSENSRLSEKTVTPRIAALDWKDHSTENSSDANSPYYHYSDSATIYRSNVDATPLALVAKKIKYDESFDLNELVTGCYDRGNGTHNQMTKEKLATYGLKFRFAVATKAYTSDVDNLTNQQDFATVTADGIITSKTPAGVTNNEAVVGKEPIIRVDLIDTKHNNNLVDRRYLKIKWVLEDLEPIQLKDKTSEATLSCDNENTGEGTMKAEYTWKEFVDEVYAKANLGSGLSQDKFEQLYPARNITVTPEGWTTNWSTPKQTSAPASGSFTTVPVFKSTTNEHGDALIATWVLDAADVMTVYNNSANDTKTFKAKVEFKSTIPSESPDLWFEWTFTIKLPELPTIAGYYDQYWTQVGVQHDVLPLQWNTPEAKTVCEYDNNLMNAFTYGASGFIVNNIPSCGTWDMQFSYEQSITGYKPDYNSSAVQTMANSTTADPSVFLSGNKYVDSKHDIHYTDFAGYKFMQGATNALYLDWSLTDASGNIIDDSHTSWCGNPSYKSADLVAKPHNPAVYDLLNPLGQGDITGGDGTVTPERTHNKKISMTVWATLNNFNYIPVKTYDICLVAPLRINYKESIGNVQDGVASGDGLDLAGAFTLTDFRGYLVANVADGTVTPSKEQNKYTETLWKYYEVEDPHYDLTAVRYTFKNVNGSAKIDNTLDYANSMTAARLKVLTNGNIDLSMTITGSKLSFFNNGGSNIEGDCYAYIPVTVKYGFGELKAYLKVHVYPHGQKPASAKRH